MAKRTGKGLDTGVIEICPGLKIDTRLKIGAILWLQEKYEADFNDIMKIFLKGKLADSINLIIALAIQHNVDESEDSIMRKIKQLELDELTKASVTLAELFKTDAKNSKRPEVHLQE